MIKRSSVLTCSRCGVLLYSRRFMKVSTPVGEIGICEECIKRGYKVLLMAEDTEPVKKILSDFRKFFKKYKINIDS